MLLYAGKTLYCLKYSIIISYIVKIFNIISQSAGNNSNIGSPETIRNKILLSSEIIKPVSVHVPTHLKPFNDIKFSYYLAGLIDGDGHFSKKQQLVIVFNILDIQLAYFIKKQLGYGNVNKVKNKNAVLLIVSKTEGIEKVITLINGKTRSKSKIEQINVNILSHPRFLGFSKNIKITLNSDNDLNNHWLAGFSDADASFQIKSINRKNKIEIRLNYQIDQKKDYLLKLIKDFFGGNIGYRASQDTYYYGSTSFGSAKKVINYFDHYHLQSTKHINYLKWRKVYLLIQDKKHLTELGLNKIIKLKNSMNKLNEDIKI